MVKAFRSQNVHQRLSAKSNRDTALTRVSQLYALLPKGKTCKRELSDWSYPAFGSVDMTSLKSTRLSSLNIAFLKKFKGFINETPRDSAKTKFLEYEALCLESNQKIRKLREGGNPYLQAVLLTAQRHISQVLGNLKLDDLLQCARWGPGSTSSCSGANVSNSEKFRAQPEVTKEFLSRARLCLPLLPSWSAALAGCDYGTIVQPIMPLIRGNKVTFVPKTAIVDRAIAIEPHINVFFQIGLGQLIRKKLKRAGVDLNDQTLNQRLARHGSIHNDLATIDLEGASDTICIELVRDLLPEVWFDWLNASRSHFGSLDGVEIRYQKFSSMGNGATFDLESLIFWALSKAVCQLEGYNDFWINVFGDDIIVPSGIYDKVCAVFADLGFRVNLTKSFPLGPFRESCGADWFNGKAVRPVYLKDIPVNPKQWIVICNQIRILAHEWGDRRTCCRSLKAAWEYAFAQVPRDLRYFVPYGYELSGSGSRGYSGNGILGNFDEACPDFIRSPADGWEGFRLKAIGEKSLTVTSTDRYLLTAGVFSSRQFAGNELTLRGMTEHREITLFVPGDWYSLGSWA